MPSPRSLGAALAATLLLAVPSVASADKASHKGWPAIDMHLTNMAGQSRPLDARPGMDPFDGQDPSYSCLQTGKPGGACLQYFTMTAPITVMPGIQIHSELLGGNGSDVIHGGDFGDVIWGDFEPSGQPAGQHDMLYGGAGKDFMYVSHGLNDVYAGGGDDRIHAHFGHGIIDCGPGNDTLFVSHKTVKLYKISNCEHISYKLNAY